MEAFLATVDKVYPTNTPLLSRSNTGDNVAVFNGNKNFADSDARLYGAITYRFEDTRKVKDYAFPFDKNNFTFPIKGETVIIIRLEGQSFYLPYSVTPYSNYRRDILTYTIYKEEDTVNDASVNTAQERRQIAAAGGTTNASTNTNKSEKEYPVKEGIKFLKPKEGDTILSGRVGNTIRFSEYFLNPDDKTASPSIIIRNHQAKVNDSKPIGELIEENINDDGSSIYFVSNKIKVPFKETVKKSKVGFKGYPNDLTGDQLFLNSDRVILSAKASEFIIFGKGNTGVITDGNFSVDAKNQIYLHSEKNVTIHSKGSNQIFLNSDSGKIFLGKNSSPGAAGADVQKMVLGGELVKILGDLIDAINQQFYLTPAGPTKVSPENAANFNQIKGKLNTLLSANNFLSKS